MTFPLKVALAGLLASTYAAGLAVFNVAHAEYPVKPVSFIVPWPPGDLEDVLTRMIAEDFQAEYGVPAVVVNKPGAGRGPFPGAIEAAAAPADGYTVGSFIVAVPVLGDQIGIGELDPMPFQPLGHFLTYPFVIAVSGDEPYDDMAGLAAYAQDNEVTLGHFGVNLIPTRVTMAAAKAMEFDYASYAALEALDCHTLASGEADVINTTVQMILPCLDDVKVLASIGTDRLSVTPETPTVQELLPEIDLALWNGLFVHKDTPTAVREKIVRVAQKTVMSERAQSLARDTGALVYWQGADATTARITADKASFDRITYMLGN